MDLKTKKGRKTFWKNCKYLWWDFKDYFKDLFRDTFRFRRN